MTMNMISRSRTARLAAAFVIAGSAVAGSVGVTAGPASATMTVRDSADCPDGRFCVWTDDYWEGHFAYFSTGSPNLAVAIGGYVFNNRITSYWNRSSTKTFCMWNGSNSTLDRLVRATPGTYNVDLPSSSDNKATSIATC